MSKTAGAVRASRRRPPTADEMQAGFAGGWEIAKFQPTLPQQEAQAHLVENDILIFSAGNFAGKTIWAVYVAVGCCLGMFKWCPVPADVMLVGLSIAQSRSAFQRYLKRFMPKEMVKHSTTRDGLTHIVEFWGGSTLTVGTVSQGAELHQGSRRSVIVYDEQPSYEVFEEGLFRLREDISTRIIFTMTPTKGKSWVFHDLLEKDVQKHVKAVQATVFENGVGVCKTCGIDRAGWNAILSDRSISRRSEPWIRAQTQATMESRCSATDGVCGRCWTYGIEPRVQAEKVKDNLARVQDPKRAAMRFLGDWKELDGDAVFANEEIKALRTYAQTQKVLRREGAFTFWALPALGHKYAIGVDGSRGIEQCESVICVLDRTTGHQVVCFGDNTAKFTEYVGDVADLAREYGNAKICVEIASSGEGIVPILMNIPGLDLYTYESPYTKRFAYNTKGTVQCGLPQSTRTRNRILMAMIAGIRKALVRDPDGIVRVHEAIPDAIYIRDTETIAQLGELYYDEEAEGQKAGKISKPKHKLDDRVFALALAWEARGTKMVGGERKRLTPGQSHDALWRAYLKQGRIA